MLHPGLYYYATFKQASIAFVINFINICFLCKISAIKIRFLSESFVLIKISVRIYIGIIYLEKGRGKAKPPEE
jgi:hypothetical protein